MTTQKHKAWKSPLVKEAISTLKHHYKNYTQYLQDHPTNTLENLKDGHEILSVLAETGTLDAATLAYVILDEGFNSTGERLNASRLSPKLAHIGAAVASRKDNARLYMLLPTKMPDLDKMTPSGLKVTIASAITLFENLFAHAADSGPEKVKMGYPHIVKEITKYHAHVSAWQKKNHGIPGVLFKAFDKSCKEALATQKKGWFEKFQAKNLGLRFNSVAEISFREQQLVRMIQELASDYIYEGGSVAYYKKSLPLIAAEPNTYPGVPAALEVRLQEMDFMMAHILRDKAENKFGLAAHLLPILARDILNFKEGMKNSDSRLNRIYISKAFSKSALNVLHKNIKKMNEEQRTNPEFLAKKLKPVADKLIGL